MCGRIISYTSTYCVGCSHVSQRKVHRPNREELKDLIKNLQFTMIGDKYGVSSTAVKKWCKSYGLPFRKCDIDQYSNDEWMLI